MRAFLAVELPPEVQAALDRLQEDLQRSVRGWRWTRPEAIHLTLRFLGEASDEFVSAGRERWARAASAVAPFALVARGLGCFPGPRRPRVLWLAVHEVEAAGPLAALAAGLERATAEAGFAPEQRAFRAHLTLARAMRGGDAAVPVCCEAEIAAPIPVTQVVLFRSDLLASGARYTALARFPLSAGAGPA